MDTTLGSESRSNAPNNERSLVKEAVKEFFEPVALLGLLVVHFIGKAVQRFR